MEGYVALGSSLGDREAHLRAGLAGMTREGIRPTAVSSVWETEPVDSGSPDAFLNMVVRVQTDREPIEILERLLEIERREDRVRGRRNAPRTLDLDLLLLGDVELDDPRLVLPHPRMWERAFVLAPLAELAPVLRNPNTGLTVRETLQKIGERPWVRLAAPATPPL
ncbi:MAG: 2-amino-4-hydroxy-6-hydroxymethyldihydropteridine diphosphokinase [Acidobacteriota bacterium]|nr:2-amino-4-hydroxy-6-hydroxymethyldihydropteridine diphosphokinase [Acidobacteriota bacterium]